MHETSPPSIREQYEAREAHIRAIIRPIVIAADAEGLIKTGAPDSEYDHEIADLAKHICREQGVYGKIQLSIDQLAHIVANVFSLSFHSWTEFPRMTAGYSKLGENLWYALYRKDGQKLPCL